MQLEYAKSLFSFTQSQLIHLNKRISDGLKPRLISQRSPNLPDEIERIARQIIVKINSQKHSSASGVIIARQGDTYYVLMPTSVVADFEKYEVVTPEGKKHSVPVNDIVRPGGLDAAIVSFTSDRIGSIASYTLVTI